MSLNRSPPSSLPDQLDKLSLQTIDSLPDELLLPIFGNLSALERASILQICKKWNQVILLHVPFWQYLHLSENLSPSSIVRILSIFNERSGCRLKHVIIETKITNVKHLNRIFVQLKRSGSSLKTLAVLQDSKLNGKTRALAMQHFPALDFLLTVSDLALLRSGVAYTLEHRARLGIRDGSIGLRCFVTEALLELTPEDLRWISRLNYLGSESTENIMSMKRILETTDNLLELDLSGWAMLEEPSSSTTRSRSRDPDPIHFRNLVEIGCPRKAVSSLALKQMLEIDGDQTRLSSTVESSVFWKVSGLKAASLHLPSYLGRDYGDMLVKKARKFFQLNPTIQSLTLRCFRGVPGGYIANQHHINKILEILDFPSPTKSQKPGTLVEGETDFFDREDGLVFQPSKFEQSEETIDNFEETKDDPILPLLVKLTIEDPVKLDGNLLHKIVQARREGNSQFRLGFKEGEPLKEVVTDDWEARGWLR